MSIERAGPTVSMDAIRELESRLAARLPDAYRAFLLEFNGGQPVHDRVDVEGFAESPVDVAILFGIGREIVTETIGWQLDVLAERWARLEPLVGRLLPIAGDSCGSVFVLRLDGTHAGAIEDCDLESVFADHERVPELHPVAASFSRFLSGLAHGRS